MSEGEIERNSKYQEKLDKTKEVIKNNWKPFTVGVVFTGVTLVVTRRFTLRYMHLEGTNVMVHKAIINDGGTFYKVFNIYESGFKNRGPSWMVRCKETGKLYRSQKQAAKVMNLSREQMSKHLNTGPNQLSNVGGYHFERIGIAA